MEGINNIKKKILITIFTTLFLIGFIYPVYSQATSTQNNAVSSLESNSIIQWIINSSINGYSTAGQYLANFISIKRVPSYVWTSITFLMTTLLFVAIYAFLFEIFIQRTGISESETMKKAKILLIFALSVFSAIAIGFAIPFLFNLYGFILLILLLVALFFFGRATISYGKSFHYAAKSFAANVEKDLVNAEKELKEAKRYLSEEEVNQITEGIDKILNIYYDAKNAISAADQIFQNALSTIIKEYKSFIRVLISDLNSLLNSKKIQDKKQLQQFINHLRNIGKRFDPTNKQTIPSISGLYNMILDDLNRNFNFNPNDKNIIINALYNRHTNNLRQNTRILSEVQKAIHAYEIAGAKLKSLYSYENTFKNDINLRFRQFLHVTGSRKIELVMLSTLKDLKNFITNDEKIINDNIKFLRDVLR